MQREVARQASCLSGALGVVAPDCTVQGKRGRAARVSLTLGGQSLAAVPHVKLELCRMSWTSGTRYRVQKWGFRMTRLSTPAPISCTRQVHAPVTHKMRSMDILRYMLQAPLVIMLCTRQLTASFWG